MAISSTTATLYISQNNFHTLTPNTAPFFSCSLHFATKPRKLVVRNSGSGVSDETSSTEIEPETSIKAPTGSSSLISSLNVERALRGIAITDVDHYATLGLQRGCSYEQVTIAYKNKVEEMKSQELEEEEVAKKMELLKESYSILSSEEERRLYDWSLARNGKPDRYVWPFEVDITPTSKGTPPPQEPEDVGPTRVVGYFMLGWLILSFVLSIALNR
ncbi:NAD(P)H-quinone oxidoreductase subunit U, chloroplastic-like [Pistacia vera]|uniref:NAD(P)H-quinone oxidoreductase subunit U, chloroplastic-like n=1 Tax=Pistacia vera TaxID=55513 RepID=UPI0012633F67|nr:NAD(P)H-quinone oxidoreductase subunit U, chloroplastic-like [Pistacia vera]